MPAIPAMPQRPVRRAREDEAEAGSSIITVMLVVVVLVLLSATMGNYVVAANGAARKNQDWQGALAAAEAGVDDYVARLRQNPDYWKTTDSANPALSGFTAVAGSATDNEAQYRYGIDTSRLTQDGSLTLAATGKVRNKQRTVTTKLRRSKFTDYMYLSDYDTMDPALYSNPAWAQANCAKYWYAGRSHSCTEIYFWTGDTLQGPVHSNDAVHIMGTPRFEDIFTTSYTGNPRWVPNGSAATNYPIIRGSKGSPDYQAVLQLPSSNTELKALTDPPATGCLFTGPTRIVFNGSTMNVTSPFTPSSGVNCPPGSNRPLPANGVIYVQPAPAGTTCPTGHPLRGNPLDTNDRSYSSYGCTNADVFVEGNVTGGVTVAAENNIYVTWHLTVTNGSSGTDSIGLIANNFVEVYHPVRTTGANLNIAGHGDVFRNATIQAAIMTLQHSFRVQNYGYGAGLGQLRVTGSIIQRFRGIVKSGSSGYDKLYVYDARFKWLSPPNFLDPVQSAWKVSEWAE